ncbi:Uncharacterized conserved protein, DUF1015 family [Actinopolyspora xinjiangensis]|uniref:Uncharacterized conserved protein, DUF1015 family n=1 Tax=Actinopolyspora xinjiangensis TaxID=405564 RepID=A0A1H0RRF4_9ACTN|nr:DUF1015 family protein [Actinopolyspora xinjiangensis]SDP32131.1 Uncharacterized conserved protein, DUF1015 family [Actinopolyspora xinjiangensis]
MSPPRTQHVTTAPQDHQHRSTGITVRSPRLLVIDQRWVESLDGSLAPERVRRLLDSGGFVHPPLPAVVVYRLRAGRHQQTGVVVEVSLDDYRAGRIRRHEATRPERERRIEQLTEAGGVEQMPVTLTHRDRPRLRDLLERATTREPDIRADSAGGVEHTVWIRRDAELARTLEYELANVPALYIADGHHRMAVAERNGQSRPHSPGDDTRAFTLAALFPSSQMRILGYHRCLPADRELSTPWVLEQLAALPLITRIEECTSTTTSNPAPGVVLLRVNDRCFRLRLRAPTDADQVRAGLDAVLLDEWLLPAVSDIVAADGLDGQNHESGGRCWCSHRNAICLVPHPPTVEQVMAVSDSGLVMPPKSTWFDPKAAAGLFARELR